MMNKLVYLLSRVTQALAPRVDEWSPSHGGKTESCVVGGNNCRLSLPMQIYYGTDHLIQNFRETDGGWLNTDR